MNRLIFVKFLEDKKIVRPDLLNTIKQVYDNGMYPQTFYQTFLEPYSMTYSTSSREPRPQIDQIEPFEGIPYLNGGLFRPELNGSDELDEREFNVRDSVLMSIIELLEQYQFSADGGPTDIDPSVLGQRRKRRSITLRSTKRTKQGTRRLLHPQRDYPLLRRRNRSSSPVGTVQDSLTGGGDGAKQNLTTMTNYTILSTHSQRTKT